MIRAKSYYSDIYEYQNTMRCLIIDEFEIIKKMKKDQTCKNIELHFILKSRKNKGESKDNIWRVTFPLPKYLIPPEELIGDPMFVNAGDSIKIKWDPSLNPSDFKDIVSSFKGKIMKISGGELTAEFHIKQTLRPPDVKNPSDPNATRPKRIQYDIHFLPNDSVFRRRMNALEKIDRLSRPMKDVLCGHPIGEPKQTRCAFKIEGFNLNESQQLAIDVACNNAFTLIQGPPGCGKTHTIGAIAIKLLESARNRQRKSKIILCGTTNVSIKSLLEICGEMISKSGFKATWATSKFFEEKLEENDLNEENNPICKHMMLYQMMQKSQEFLEMQKIIFREPDKMTSEKQELYDELRRNLEETIIEETDVIFSTLDSCGKQCLEAYEIEAVIVDEAAFSIEASMIIPLLYLPSKLILVGDRMQLLPINQRTIPELKKIGFYTSLYERIDKKYRNSFLLDTQYRMHPDILQFPNDKFYAGLINNGVNPEDREMVDIGFNGHINFVNEKEGQETQKGTSFFNEKEAYDVFLVVRNLINAGVDKRKIGVITPYRQQVKLIKRKCSLFGVTVHSVDSYQGSERDYIIISTVRSDKCNNGGLSFVSSSNRINVSLTRARCFLVVIGNKEAIESSDVWSDFIDFTICNGWYYEKIPYKRKQVTPLQITKGSTQSNDMDDIYESDKLISMFKDNGIKGTTIREIKSPIGQQNVRVLWPDRNDDIEFLKQWTKERLDILKLNLNVTLSYDSECACLQFGDIFEYHFDCFKWKNGDQIPKIKNCQSIILTIYQCNKPYEKSLNLINIIKPLLEHPNVTLITFDFTYDLDKLFKLGINIKTKRIIDTQLSVVLGDPEQLITSTNWKSLASLIRNISKEDLVNQELFLNAIDRINNQSKQFPHEENKFCFKYLDIPKICIFTKTFFEYSSDDIFLTAILFVDILLKQRLDSVKEYSSKKLEQYFEIKDKYGYPTYLRNAHFTCEHYTKAKQSYFDNNFDAVMLLRLLKLLNSYISLWKKGIEYINSDILNMTEKDLEIFERRAESVIAILKSGDNLIYIKERAILSNITGIDETEQNIDDFF